MKTKIKEPHFLESVRNKIKIMQKIIGVKNKWKK